MQHSDVGTRSAPGLAALLNLAPALPKCHAGEHLWSPPAELLCEHSFSSEHSSAAALGSALGLTGAEGSEPSLDSCLQTARVQGCPDVQTQLQSLAVMGYCHRKYQLHPDGMKYLCTLWLHRVTARVSVWSCWG